jgi:hypothetical protein
MALANTLAYYDTAKIMAVNFYVVQSPVILLDFSKHLFAVDRQTPSLNYCYIRPEMPARDKNTLAYYVPSFTTEKVLYDRLQLIMTAFSAGAPSVTTEDDVVRPFAETKIFLPFYKTS